MEINHNVILSEYSEKERTAYLAALAALATSDREATEQEAEQLRQVANEAGLSEDFEQQIIEAAKDPSGQNLKNSLDVLKESDLRYGLITDLIAVAKADDSYTEEEKNNIEKVSEYLNVNRNQFSVLDQFVNRAADEKRTPEEYTSPNFLTSTGMQEKFSNAGFNKGSMSSGIFGFLGPLLLGSLAAKNFGRRKTGATAGLGGGLSGMLGNMISGNRNQAGMGGLSGGLGSLLSGLAGSRSNGRMGGMLGRLFR